MMLALVMMMMVVVVEVVCLCLSQPLTSPLPATLRAPLAGFQLFVMMLRMLIMLMLVVEVVCLCLSQPLTSPPPRNLKSSPGRLPKSRPEVMRQCGGDEDDQHRHHINTHR